MRPHLLIWFQVEQGDDDLMHFKWKDRTSGTVEDDLIIFPDDIDFLKVDQVIVDSNIRIM